MIIDDLRAEHDQLSADGFRVLALAYKDLPAKAAYSKDDEGDLVLKGNVAFLDPPKETALEAVRGLREHGGEVMDFDVGGGQAVRHPGEAAQQPQDRAGATRLPAGPGPAATGRTSSHRTSHSAS
jgi:hypothetical protein